MSDTRFTIIGIALVFAGFLVFGVFDQGYYNAAIQAHEFRDCYDFTQDGRQVEVDCDTVLQNQALFFGFVIGLVGLGIFFLIKGIRGKWDQDVKPEDAVGPGSSFPS